MTISCVAAFSAASTSVALSGIVAGDLLIAVAYRNASATAATIPSGWTAIAGATGGGTTNALVAAYKIAAGGETTSGVWTNATQVGVSQYRSTNPASLKVGAGAATGATSTSASIPALTLANPAASSWVFGAIGSKTDTTLATTAPASMTRRTSVGTAGGLGVYDSAATVTSWAAKTKSVTSGAYRSVAVEFYEDTTPPTITSSNSGTVKGDGATAFSTALTASEASTWAIVAGTNAAGFTLNASTGVLSLPAQTFDPSGNNNTRTVQYTATDAAGNASAPATFTLTVTDPNIWLPTNLGSALAAWWDAQQGVTQSAGSVTQWADVVSGLLATGSAGSLPTYSATGRNGSPALLFDGNSQNLSFNPATLPVGDLFIGVAAYMNTVLGSGAWKRVFSYGTDEDNTSIQVIRRGDPVCAEYTAGTSPLDWSGFDRFLEVAKAGTAGQIWVDAQAGTTTGTFGGNITGPYGYIGRGLRYPDYWPGSIQQIVILNRVLTTTEQQQLEGWESWYDGKAGSNLPAGHPYKTAAPTVATGGTGGTTYTATMALGLTPAQGVAGLLSGVSPAALALSAAQAGSAQLAGASSLALATAPGVTAAGGSVYGATIPLGAVAALAGSPSVTAAVTAALAEVAGIGGSAQTSAAAVLTLAALAGQSGSGGLTAASAFTLAQAAGLTDTSTITAAQGAALAM
ncbi:MAG: hypothetical protein INR63_12170, partial [Actinomycetospora chiangmaiensis]|nr:hypothetical protein [Actinomycetospora chiangmaiensis]